MKSQKESSLQEQIASINQDAMAGLYIAAVPVDETHEHYIGRLDRWDALVDHAKHIKGQIALLLGVLESDDRTHFEQQIVFLKLAARIYEMDTPPRGVVEGMLADILRVANGDVFSPALRQLSFLPTEKRAREDFFFFLATPGAKPLGGNVVGHHRLPNSRSERREMIGAIISRLLISHREDGEMYEKMLACLHFHRTTRPLVLGD